MPIAPPVLDDRRRCPGGVVVGLAQPLDRGGKPLQCKARVTSGLRPDPATATEPTRGRRSPR
jgi:hypothetical protein